MKWKRLSVLRLYQNPWGTGTTSTAGIPEQGSLLSSVYSEGIKVYWRGQFEKAITRKPLTSTCARLSRLHMNAEVVLEVKRAKKLTGAPPTAAATSTMAVSDTGNPQALHSLQLYKPDLCRASTFRHPLQGH